MQTILTGNVNEIAPGHRGWVMGHFMEQGSALHTTTVEVKWGNERQGNKKDNPKANRTATTLSIITRGSMRYEFPETGQTIILEKEGDYLFLPPGISHSWEALTDCLVITVRWPSVPEDQQ